MSKDPRITSNSDGHFAPAVERQRSNWTCKVCGKPHVLRDGSWPDGLCNNCTEPYQRGLEEGLRVADDIANKAEGLASRQSDATTFHQWASAQIEAARGKR